MQKEMLEDLRRTTMEIVNDLERERLAEYLECRDERDGSQFNVLISPGAVQKERTIIVISGIPEEAGVWSYTLISQGKREEASMRRYFEMVKRLDWGMIALNPHGRGRIGDEEEYLFQLETILKLLLGENPERCIVFLCFSAGGSVLFSFLNTHTEIAARTAGTILIDTTPPPLSAGSIRKEVKDVLSKTVLYGLKDRKNNLSPYASTTSTVLGISQIPVRGDMHGDLPSLLVGDVEKHLKQFAAR